MNLTPIQKETFHFIKNYIAANHFPPTMREMAEHFGVSIKAIVDRIAMLKRKGVITMCKSVHRGIAIKAGV